MRSISQHPENHHFMVIIIYIYILILNSGFERLHEEQWSNKTSDYILTIAKNWLLKQQYYMSIEKVDEKPASQWEGFVFWWVEERLQLSPSPCYRYLSVVLSSPFRETLTLKVMRFAIITKSPTRETQGLIFQTSASRNHKYKAFLAELRGKRERWMQGNVSVMEWRNLWRLLFIYSETTANNAVKHPGGNTLCEKKFILKTSTLVTLETPQCVFGSMS